MKEGRTIPAQVLVRWECVRKDASGYGITEEKAKKFLLQHYREAHPMNVPTYRKVVKVIHEYSIPSPATARDVADAQRHVHARLKESNRKQYADYDDAYWVKAWDEEIVFYWEEEEE